MLLIWCIIRRTLNWRGLFKKRKAGGDSVNEAEMLKGKKNKKLLKPRRNNHPLLKLFGMISGFAFVMYCVSSIVLTQAEISEKRQELAVLSEKAERLEAENDEYQSILSEDDEKAFMERYAIDVLGYAYPNERRFYDTTGN